MRATCATLGYTVAAALVLLGAHEMFVMALREWYFDGHITFDATGREMSSSTTIWVGPGLFTLGILIAGAVHQLRARR